VVTAKLERSTKAGWPTIILVKVFTSTYLADQTDPKGNEKVVDGRVEQSMRQCLHIG